MLRPTVKGRMSLFRLGIVDRNPAVAKVHRQCRPLVPQIAQRLADPAAGQRPLHGIAVQPAPHAVPDRHRVALPQLLACRGVQGLAPFFDIIQLLVERNRLRRQDRIVRLGLDKFAAGVHVATGMNDPSAGTLLQTRIGPAGVAHEDAAIRGQMSVDHRVLMRQRPVKHIVRGQAVQARVQPGVTGGRTGRAGVRRQPRVQRPAETASRRPASPGLPRSSPSRNSTQASCRRPAGSAAQAAAATSAGTGGRSSPRA